MLAIPQDGIEDTKKDEKRKEKNNGYEIGMLFADIMRKREDSPMDDYIKREDAIKVVQHTAMEFVDADTRREMIVAVPSADVVERKRGEWILVCDAEGEGDNLYRCSVCGCEYGCQEYDLPKYCGECGADMRKGK